MGEIEQILKNHKLRITAIRKRTLEILRKSEAALAQSELEGRLSEFDRVTIYRTLTSFEESGLVHRIVNESGVGNYALCVDACDSDHHHDHHLHLECDNCGKVYCLDEVVIPEIQIPAHYKAHGLKITTHGLCSSCQERATNQ